MRLTTAILVALSTLLLSTTLAAYCTKCNNITLNAIILHLYILTNTLLVVRANISVERTAIDSL
jgi:hypothetical protein